MFSRTIEVPSRALLIYHVISYSRCFARTWFKSSRRCSHLATGNGGAAQLRSYGWPGPWPGNPDGWRVLTDMLKRNSPGSGIVHCFLIFCLFLFRENLWNRWHCPAPFWQQRPINRVYASWLVECQGIDLSLVVNISSWYASVEASLLGPFKFEVGDTCFHRAQ